MNVLNDVPAVIPDVNEFDVAAITALNSSKDTHAEFAIAPPFARARERSFAQNLEATVTHVRRLTALAASFASRPNIFIASLMIVPAFVRSVPAALAKFAVASRAPHRI